MTTRENRSGKKDSRRLTQMNADTEKFPKKSAQISTNQRQKNKTAATTPRQGKKKPKKLRINRVDFAYNTRKVLEDLSLDISENEVVAVVGQNGAGKSTLLKIIMGFEKAISTWTAKR